jgi:hypothetical protein
MRDQLIVIDARRAILPRKYQQAVWLRSRRQNFQFAAIGVGITQAVFQQVVE